MATRNNGQQKSGANTNNFNRGHLTDDPHKLKRNKLVLRLIGQDGSPNGIFGTTPDPKAVRFKTYIQK